MTFDDAAATLSRDVCGIANKWLYIKLSIECESNHTTPGDIDLERAYRRICELKEHIENIRTARRAAIGRRCIDCGEAIAEYPSVRCAGCEAFAEHTA